MTVRLHFTPTSIWLEVRDDGIGFDPLTIPPAGQGGVGLRSITERAARLGGTLTCDSSPGAGTQVKVEVTL